MYEIHSMLTIKAAVRLYNSGKYSEQNFEWFKKNEH